MSKQYIKSYIFLIFFLIFNFFCQILFIFVETLNLNFIIMKRTLLLSIIALFMLTLNAQIDPLNSPYYGDGSYSVESMEIMDISPDLLVWKPTNSNDGPYPTILFQPGANAAGADAIDKHSYDLYFEHLASYGYVIIIINNTAGGPNASLFTNTHDWIKSEIAGGSSWMNDYVDLNRFIAAGHSNGGMNATDLIIDRPEEVHGIIYMASYPNPGMMGFGAQNVTNYPGKVMLLCGDEDDTSVPLAGSTNDVARTAYNDRFTSVDCKTWGLFNGIGHGGFGDYDNPDQPVGSIGREPTTASIRHMLVAFLNSQFKDDAIAGAALTSEPLRPNTLGEFENTCGVEVDPDEEYTVTFNVVEVIEVFGIDIENPIEGASVVVTGQSTLTTDAEGQATLDLISGTYTYDVSADGYIPQADLEVVVNGANKSVTIILEPEGASGDGYTVTFNVTSGGMMPVSEATISIVGQDELVTNFMGSATINLENGTYNFSVTADGYEPYSADFTVADEELTVPVDLIPEGGQDGFSVNFIVTTGGMTPVEGATIAITGQSTLTTDNFGMASIQLENGTYTYDVSATGYVSQTGLEVIVDGANENVTIDLEAVVSINQDIANNVIIYPNPVSSIVNIEAKEFDNIQIIDATGKVVYNEIIVNNTTSINIEKYSKGLYIIKLSNDNNSVTKRLIVK